jgi:hypothetical protein
VRLIESDGGFTQRHVRESGELFEIFSGISSLPASQSILSLFAPIPSFYPMTALSRLRATMIISSAFCIRAFMKFGR